MRIMLAIMAIILFCGMIVGENAKDKKNFTYGFMVTILAIAYMYL